MSDNVCVAVRVRPFNERERSRDATCCVVVDPEKPNTCTLQNPSDPMLQRQFTFDHVFDSFTDDPARLATQRTVWEAVGMPLLEAAWEGYNSTVFAYGQTGSGKSHSMVGFDHTDKGIIPTACERLFERIGANEDPELSFRVECSMLEIYNERIRDLFVPFTATGGGRASSQELNRAGLKLRDSPSLGVVVEGLRACPVGGFDALERLMANGTKNRTIAATNMNETSSRAHTIFMVKLTQTRVERTELGGGEARVKATDRTSVLNLVDLAGSERQRGSGAAGDRLREAGAINKSLSALGNVISALAFNAGLAEGGRRAKRLAAAAQAAADAAAVASGKGLAGAGVATVEKHVPYRDSVLTHLLRNSLGGNARTTMLAAVSPADVNFEETLSTLRYADRAKQIKNKAVVNEGVDEKLIKELKEQVEALRRELAVAKLGGTGSSFTDGSGGGGTDGSGGGAPSGGVGAGADVDALLANERAAMRERMEAEVEARLREYEAAMTRRLEAAELAAQRRASAAGGGSAGSDSDAAASEAAAASAVSAARAAVDEDNAAAVARGPRLSNLNEDPALSGVLAYRLLPGSNRLGKGCRGPGGDGGGGDDDGSSSDGGDSGGSSGCAGGAHEVVLGGLGVLPAHCTITVQAPDGAGGANGANGLDDTGGDGAGAAPRFALWLVPRPGARCCVNGSPAPADGVALANDDRLVLGTNCVLRVHVPGGGGGGSGGDSSGGGGGRKKVIDWQLAMAELNGALIAAMGGGGGGGGGSGGSGSRSGGGGGSGGGAGREAAALESHFAAERDAMALKMQELEAMLAEERQRAAVAAAEATAAAAAAAATASSSAVAAPSSSSLTSAPASSTAPSGRGSDGDDGSGAGSGGDGEQAARLRQVAALEAALAEQVAQTRRLAARHELELANRTVLDEELLRMLPLVHEANTISGELGRGLRFAVKLVSKALDAVSLAFATGAAGASVSGGGGGGGGARCGGGGTLAGANRLTTVVAILVHHDHEPDREPAMWSSDKFNNRASLLLSSELFSFVAAAHRSSSSRSSRSSSSSSSSSNQPRHQALSAPCLARTLPCLTGFGFVLSCVRASCVAGGSLAGLPLLAGIYLMREMYQLWLEAGSSVDHPVFATSVFAAPSGDPFYDPPEDTLVKNMRSPHKRALTHTYILKKKKKHTHTHSHTHTHTMCAVNRNRTS